jgi:hypothetical protein
MTEHYQAGHGDDAVVYMKVKADLKGLARWSFAQNIPKVCPNHEKKGADAMNLPLFHWLDAQRCGLAQAGWIFA